VGTVKFVVDVEAAAALAEIRLARALPRRWRHVQAVAQRARSVAMTLSLPDDLVVAAWLHDIGYAPELAETGFHPLDGARFLRRAGVDRQVVSLVAYHSCAQIEADVRGLGAELAAEFTPADPLLSDALLYWDMTTGPDGDHVRPADRLGEIHERYGLDTRSPSSWSWPLQRSSSPPSASRRCSLLRPGRGSATRRVRKEPMQSGIGGSVLVGDGSARQNLPPLCSGLDRIAGLARVPRAMACVGTAESEGQLASGGFDLFVLARLSENRGGS